MRVLILVTLAVLLATPPVAAEVRCIMSYCKDRAPASTPSRSYITNTSRQIIGDLYDPGHGRRIQIRDTSRRIIGYIEADGTVTNTSRQVIGTLRE